MAIDLRESLLLRAERHRPDVLPAPDLLLDTIDEPIRPPRSGRKPGRPRAAWKARRPTPKQLRWLDELHARHRGQPSEQVRTLWRHLTRGKVAILLDQLVALERAGKKSGTGDARNVDT